LAHFKNLELISNTLDTLQAYFRPISNTSGIPLVYLRQLGAISATSKTLSCLPNHFEVTTDKCDYFISPRTYLRLTPNTLNSPQVTSAISSPPQTHLSHLGAVSGTSDTPSGLPQPGTEVKTAIWDYIYLGQIYS
jgi:hypothetical protein